MLFGGCMRCWSMHAIARKRCWRTKNKKTLSKFISRITTARMIVCVCDCEAHCIDSKQLPEFAYVYIFRSTAAVSTNAVRQRQTAFSNEYTSSCLCADLCMSVHMCVTISFYPFAIYSFRLYSVVFSYFSDQPSEIRWRRNIIASSNRRWSIVLRINTFLIRR